MNGSNTEKTNCPIDDHNDPDLDLAIRIREKLLKRLEHVADHAPDGLVTEVQDKRSGHVYKLADLVASYKHVTGKMAVGDDPKEFDADD